MLEIGSALVKVKWDYDQSESDCPKEDVRCKMGMNPDNSQKQIIVER